MRLVDIDEPDIYVLMDGCEYICIEDLIEAPKSAQTKQKNM